MEKIVKIKRIALSFILSGFLLGIATIIPYAQFLAYWPMILLKNILIGPVLIGLAFSGLFLVFLFAFWYLFFYFLLTLWGNGWKINLNRTNAHKLILVCVICLVILIPLLIWKAIYDADYYKHDASRLTELAVEKNDPSICDEANESKFMSGQSRSNCYFQVALKNNNISACENILNENPDLCYQVIAINLTQISICEKIKDEQYKTDCYNNVYEHLFANGKDITICNSIQKNSLKKACVYGYINAGKADFDFCKNNLSDYLDYQDLCFFKIVQKEKNEKYCAFIQNKDLINDCLAFVARSKGDEKICNMLQEDTSIYECISDIAQQKEDLNLCNKINDYQIKNRCISIIGQRKRDINICNLVQDIEERSRCMDFIKRNK